MVYVIDLSHDLHASSEFMEWNESKYNDLMLQLPVMHMFDFRFIVIEMVELLVYIFGIYLMLKRCPFSIGDNDRRLQH